MTDAKMQGLTFIVDMVPLSTARQNGRDNVWIAGRPKQLHAFRN